MESISRMRDRETGTVSIAMFNSSLIVLLGLISAFRTRSDKITVRMIGANSGQIASAVRCGSLEAGVVDLPIDTRGTGAAALAVAASGVAGAVASVQVAEALGYTKSLSWADRDFAIISRDPKTSLPELRP